jgi:hypothetical protein
MVVVLAMGGPIQGRSPDQKAVPALSGVWKLNVEASTNPNGPPPPKQNASERAAARQAESFGEVNTGLGQEERGRFEKMKAMFFAAPAMIGLQATADDFKMILDPAKNFGYAHKTDNKKQLIVTPTGPAEFKVRWDGAKLRREAETPETLKVIEEYTVSADGKQLTVTVKAESVMVANVQNGAIKRVYDRQQ